VGTLSIHITLLEHKSLFFHVKCILFVLFLGSDTFRTYNFLLVAAGSHGSDLKLATQLQQEETRRRKQEDEEQERKQFKRLQVWNLIVYYYTIKHSVDYQIRLG